MEKLSQVLWRERELLDVLLFKLEAERLVLTGGRNHWLMRAARDVEKVLETMRQTEILRAIHADEVADALGLASNPSLRELAQSSDEPWRTLLLDHHEAFLSATREVAVLADANRELIATGYQSARDRLLSIRAMAEGYDVADYGNPAVGVTARISVTDRLDAKEIVELQIQRSAFQASLAATARAMQPSLLDFLR